MKYVKALSIGTIGFVAGVAFTRKAIGEALKEEAKKRESRVRWY